MEENTPKEATNIFHSIIKASVSKQQIFDETDEMIAETKKRLNEVKHNLDEQKKAKDKSSQ